MIAQSEVDNSPLARGHRSEVERSSRLAHFFGGHRGGHAQFFEPQGALILAVEGNLLVLARGKMQHLQSKKFEGTEEFSAAIEKQNRVGTGEVDQDFRFLPVAVLGDGRVNRDAVFETQATVGNNGLEEFVDLLGSGEFVGDGHKKRALSYQLSVWPMQNPLSH